MNPIITNLHKLSGKNPNCHRLKSKNENHKEHLHLVMQNAFLDDIVEKYTKNTPTSSYVSLLKFLHMAIVSSKI